MYKYTVQAYFEVESERELGQLLSLLTNQSMMTNLRDINITQSKENPLDG